MSADVLRLEDTESLQDLRTFVRRAARADPDGSARLMTSGVGAVGGVLAVYVCPVHGGRGPTVLGLRTFGVRAPGGAPTQPGLDVVVALAALADRFARVEGQGTTDLSVPPPQAGGPSWAGVSPPRTGWQEVGVVELRELGEQAHRGITEIAAGAPDVAGAPAVAALRARVWGRPVGAGESAVPAGAAFVAQALGFLPPPAGESDLPSPSPSPAAAASVVVRARGPWRRLSLPAGHVLARPALL